MEIGVLIVDDEDDIRYLIRTIIDAADQGLRVVGEAADGEGAVEEVERLDPEVVVLDERMPGMTGLEAAALIRRSRPGQRIILCSAYLDEELRARAEEVGITICLTKQQVPDVPSALYDVMADGAA